MTEQTTSTSATATIAPAFDKSLDSKDFIFRFKKDKLGNKRANVELKGFIPSVEGIVDILQKGGKGLELLQEVIYDTIRTSIGAVVSDDETFSQAKYDATAADYTWDKIANQPREDRRASSISEEVWQAFAADYLAVMPSVANKTAEQLGNAVAVFTKKFAQVKTNKEVIKMLKAQLGLYVEHTTRGEEFQEIIDLLDRKADSYLNANDTELLVQNL